MIFDFFPIISDGSSILWRITANPITQKNIERTKVSSAWYPMEKGNRKTLTRFSFFCSFFFFWLGLRIVGEKEKVLTST